MASVDTGPTTLRTDEYVLGTHADELARLGIQHQVWRAQAYAAFDLGGFGPGQTILDVGCGPGYATMDIAAIVGEPGRVVAIDVADRFLDHLRAEIGRAGASNVTVARADVQAMGDVVAPGSCDGAYARWVLCFVAQPDKVVAEVARALRPGGRFVVQDYVNYRALTVAPRSAIVDKVVRAVEESWRARGGDPDVACRLPGMLAAHGLDVRELRPLVRIARPGSTLWNWPTTFFRNNLPILVELGLVTEDDRRAWDAEWAARTADPSSFFISPEMVDLVAVKRG